MPFLTLTPQTLNCSCSQSQLAAISFTKFPSQKFSISQNQSIIESFHMFCIPQGKSHHLVAFPPKWTILFPVYVLWPFSTVSRAVFLKYKLWLFMTFSCIKAFYLRHWLIAILCLLYTFVLFEVEWLLEAVKVRRLQSPIFPLVSR